MFYNINMFCIINILIFIIYIIKKDLNENTMVNLHINIKLISNIKPHKHMLLNNNTL